MSPKHVIRSQCEKIEITLRAAQPKLPHQFGFCPPINRYIALFLAKLFTEKTHDLLNRAYRRYR
jgi:hypothetical protein